MKNVWSLSIETTLVQIKAHEMLCFSWAMLPISGLRSLKHVSWQLSLPHGVVYLWVQPTGLSTLSCRTWLSAVLGWTACVSGKALHTVREENRNINKKLKSENAKAAIPSHMAFCRNTIWSALYWISELQLQVPSELSDPLPTDKLSSHLYYARVTVTHNLHRFTVACAFPSSNLFFLSTFKTKKTKKHSQSPCLSSKNTFWCWWIQLELVINRFTVLYFMTFSSSTANKDQLITLPERKEPTKETSPYGICF